MVIGGGKLKLNPFVRIHIAKEVNFFVYFYHLNRMNRKLILFLYIYSIFSVSFHLRLREVLVIFNDWQIVVRTVYYYSIVSDNYNQQLSVSEGLPYNLLRSIPANPPSLYIVTLPV